MLYGVLKTLLHISPVFLDLSDPYPGHGGRSCGRFLPHPGRGAFHVPQRGGQNGFYTECSPNHWNKFQYLWETLESFSLFAPRPPEFHLLAPQVTWV